jgi:hypothetical protein
MPQVFNVFTVSMDRVADPDSHGSALFLEAGPGSGYALEQKAGSGS